MVWLNARVSYRWGSGRGVVLQDRVEQEAGLEVVVRAWSSSIWNVCSLHGDPSWYLFVFPSFFISLWTLIILFLVVWIENFPKSVQIHFLLSFSETEEVVPLPTKKSHTISPGFEDAFIILSNNFSGFWVGYDKNSFLWIEKISSQTSLDFTFPSFFK